MPWKEAGAQPGPLRAVSQSLQRQAHHPNRCHWNLPGKLSVRCTSEPPEEEVRTLVANFALYAIFRLFLVGPGEGGGRCRSQVEPEPQTHLGPYLKQTSSPPLQSHCLSWALPCAHSLGEGRASNSGPSWLGAKKFGYLLQTQLGGCGASESCFEAQTKSS